MITFQDFDRSVRLNMLLSLLRLIGLIYRNRYFYLVKVANAYILSFQISLVKLYWYNYYYYCLLNGLVYWKRYIYYTKYSDFIHLFFFFFQTPLIECSSVCVLCGIWLHVTWAFLLNGLVYRKQDIYLTKIVVAYYPSDPTRRIILFSSFHFIRFKLR